MDFGQALQYPPHFPPSTAWKRFFIGVRGLGPDLDFFKKLRASQGSRTAESMSVWGGGERQALAVAVGSIFAKFCNWPSPHFLPGDSVAVIAGGSAFGWIDETDVGEAIGAIEELVGTKMPQGFWGEAGSSTLGQLLDQLASAAGPYQSFKPTPSARLISDRGPIAMQSRDWIAISTSGLFLVPAALLVYAASLDGAGMEHGIYSTVETLRGMVDPGSGEALVSLGMFLTAWWWFIAFGCVAFSALVASALAVTQPGTSVGIKAIWVFSFYVLVVTVPIYCIWQMGSRPRQSSEPTPSARPD